MLKYFVHRDNGNVARIDTKGINVAEYFVPLTDQEVEEYEAWARRCKKAVEIGDQPPPQPAFGPMRLKEDLMNVVADVQPEAVAEAVLEAPVVEEPAIKPEKRGRPRKDDGAKALDGLLGGKNS